MQLKKDDFLHYLHYFILIVALSVCLYIGYSKFIYSEPSSKESYVPYSSDNAQVLDSNQVISPDLLPDSTIRVPPGAENIPVPRSPDNNEVEPEKTSPNNSESNFEPRSGGSSKDPKTWMELIIDLLETLTPLLLPVISYYFKPNSTNET